MKELIYNQGENINTPKSKVFIYCWENLLNQKKYIGQTKQGKKRLRDEKCLHNVYGAFKEALLKYGQINFKCYILEYCTIDELDEKEKYWINELNSHCSKWGYNLTWGGQDAPKYTFYSLRTNKFYKTLEAVPEEEFDYMCKYDLITYSIVENIKPFYVFNKNGEILKKFISLNSAAAFCDKETSSCANDNIRSALSGHSKSAYGYIWSYNKISPIYINKNFKSVAKYDLNGNLIEVYNTIRDAAKSINTTDKIIWSCLNRDCVKQTNGFMWRYVDENFEIQIKPYLDQIPFKIIQYDLNHNKIKEYCSIEEASTFSGDSRTRISLNCNGHIAHTRRYIWEKHWNNKEKED